MDFGGKWFGFWQVDAGNDAHLPPLEAWIAPAWQPEDREGLLSYIENASLVVASSDLKSPCLICGAPQNSSDFRSDGDWLWPTDLAHYVSQHQIRIPDSMIQHIRQKAYIPPSHVNAAIDKLPWPS